MIFDDMQKAISDVMIKIHALPFNQELAKGTLSLQKFIFYLQQDAIYLNNFAKALAITAGRIDRCDHALYFMQCATDTIKTEQQLNSHYLKKYHANMTTVSPTPSCFMYSNYLLKTAAIGLVEEAVASLLPCFWVYQQVFCHIKNQSKKKPYQSWIDWHCSQPFITSVEQIITIVNQLGDHATVNTKNKMLLAFIYATKLEWLFWHSAYQRETWLI